LKGICASSWTITKNHATELSLGGSSPYTSTNKTNTSVHIAKHKYVLVI